MKLNFWTGVGSDYRLCSTFTNVLRMLPFPANISTSQSYLQSSRKPSAIHISMQNSWWNSNQNPEIYKLNISYNDKAKTWNVKVANWYICSNMVFQNANCLKIFYFDILQPCSSQGGRINSVQWWNSSFSAKQNKSAVSFSILVWSRPQQRTRVT